MDVLCIFTLWKDVLNGVRDTRFPDFVPVLAFEILACLTRQLFLVPLEEVTQLFRRKDRKCAVGILPA